MIESPNIQWPAGATYLTGDRGTEALGVKDIFLGVPEQVVATQDFETDPIGGTGVWIPTTSSPRSGLRCFTHPDIGNNQNADHQFTIPVGATALRFWHRVSCELNFDFLRVYKDAILPGNLLFQLSGTTNVWAQTTVSVVGATTLTVRYIKDGSGSAGLDSVFVDDFEWIIPAIPPIQVYEPLHLEPVENRLKVDVGSGVDVRPLDCLTDSVTVCIDEPLEVEVVNPVDIRPLDCVTDSVTVCISEPLEVEVANQVNVRPLTCLTDSVTVCIDEPLEVEVVNQVNVRSLTCETDAVTACIEDPVEVTQGTAPWVVGSPTGTLANGAQTAVAAAAVQILAADVNRKAALIQNVGIASIRVGVTGVTATTGFRLVPGQIVVLEMPYVPTQAIFAIREGAVSSIAFAMEIT